MEYRIKEFMDKHGISQKGLAEVTGLSPSTIRRAYRGTRILRITTMQSILEGLRELTSDADLTDRDQLNFLLKLYGPRKGMVPKKLEYLTDTPTYKSLFSPVMFEKSFTDDKPFRPRLKLELEIPEGVSDERVKEVVAEAVKKLDRLHRAKKGSGLKVIDLQAKKEGVNESVMK
ncbi:hypothetical protein FGF1_03590 [Flavobacteriaceae bacterium GF1]